MELSSVYVCVEDMERALEFYRDVFDMEPAQADERFSTFAFEAADFGLYDAGYDGFDVDVGDNCVPNFEVDDVDAAYERSRRWRHGWSTTRSRRSATTGRSTSSTPRGTTSRCSASIRRRASAVADPCGRFRPSGVRLL
jgi:predicted enzyme related to lactoylglutathione lyase